VRSGYIFVLPDLMSPYKRTFFASAPYFCATSVPFTPCGAAEDIGSERTENVSNACDGGFPDFLFESCASQRFGYDSEHGSAGSRRRGLNPTIGRDGGILPPPLFPIESSIREQSFASYIHGTAWSVQPATGSMRRVASTWQFKREPFGRQSILCSVRPHAW
jgi:hypothetical protein